MENHTNRYTGAVEVRILFGILACILLLCAAGGMYLIVQSFEEEARLAGTGASGSEYLGVSVGRLIGLILLMPAIPSCAALALAVHPGRASLIAAQVTTGLWWIVWVPILVACASNVSISAPSVIADQIATICMTTLPLVLFTVCIHYIGHRLKDA